MDGGVKGRVGSGGDWVGGGRVKGGVGLGGSIQKKKLGGGRVNGGGGSG